jgi:hypothetical protein
VPRGHIGRDEGKKIHAIGCIGRRLMVEQIENIAKAHTRAALLWKSNDGAGESGDVAGAWD